MTTNTPTPRTDAAVLAGYRFTGDTVREYVKADFVRTLERELSTAKARISQLEVDLHYAINHPLSSSSLSYNSPELRDKLSDNARHESP